MTIDRDLPIFKLGDHVLLPDFGEGTVVGETNLGSIRVRFDATGGIYPWYPGDLVLAAPVPGSVRRGRGWVRLAFPPPGGFDQP
jgi:hypothetical protein